MRGRNKPDDDDFDPYEAKYGKNAGIDALAEIERKAKLSGRMKLCYILIGGVLMALTLFSWVKKDIWLAIYTLSPFVLMFCIIELSSRVKEKSLSFCIFAGILAGSVFYCMALFTSLLFYVDAFIILLSMLCFLGASIFFYWLQHFRHALSGDPIFK